MDSPRRSLPPALRPIARRGAPLALATVLTFALLGTHTTPRAIAATPGPAKERTVRVLLVTGIDHPAHAWRETAPVLQRLLESDPRIEVRREENPDALATTDLTPWQVVLIHFQNWERPGPGQVARENLRAFVARGGGLVSVHFGCGAWHQEWPEYQAILGRVWHGIGPGKPQHDPRGPFRVHWVDREHPITRGLEDFTTTDELYTCLTGDAPIQLLAQAQSIVDHKLHPMAFARTYGAGRVFLTTLGHDVLAWTNHPTVGELVRRGTSWTAGVPPVDPRATANPASPTAP